jgi:hypothetical protein
MKKDISDRDKRVIIVEKGQDAIGREEWENYSKQQLREFRKVSIHPFLRMQESGIKSDIFISEIHTFPNGWCSAMYCGDTSLPIWVGTTSTSNPFILAMVNKAEVRAFP